VKETLMKHAKATIWLCIGIAVLATIATLLGILVQEGPGLHEFVSQHDQRILVYGYGFYQWMPADVAIQGVAQDFITLFVAIPLLLLSLWLACRGCMRALYVLAGTCGYFFVTYLFYVNMASYSALFLLHVALLGMSFFALFLSLSDVLSIEKESFFPSPKQMKWAGGFLVVNSIMVALLWLGIIVPPLLDGTIYPPELFHLTTLVVQGLDLGLLLPIAIVVGLLAWKGRSSLYSYLTVYLVFLTILMLALCSKLVIMYLAGASVIPAAFIMPTVCIIAGIFSVRILLNMKKEAQALQE
jgi:hypothetical protein